MASNKAHHTTGWAAGVIAAAVVSKAGGTSAYPLWSILGFGAAALGGTAPDWLEFAWWSRGRKRWVAHRSITHWGVAWLAMLVASYRLLGAHPPAALSFGFACGGLMHLLADWPNPLGVPWIVSRHSLNWWNSGHCDILIVGAAWIAALLSVDHLWFHGVYSLKLLQAL